MRKVLLLGSFAVLATALAGPAMTPGQAVAVELQKQFENLAPIKDGRLGVNRIEVSQLKKHLVTSGGVFFKDRTYTLDIWGRKGAPLTGGKLEVRFSRFWTGGPASVGATKARRAADQLVPKAVREFTRGKEASVTAKSGAFTIELRPIRLTKKECLKCHMGMKAGDAVAVVSVISAPAAKSSGRPKARPAAAKALARKPGVPAAKP